ncbi:MULTISPECIES: DNA ligase D [Asticcacaulis]|uniref:DNA ligase D n=1 Tax=Asticcacaulis TaxID=76890 RepID=UPI001AE5D3A7|nr:MULTISPECIES: DNA ligase D [Asticcacaulis]MBP2159118.1 bifunctional non-homologous end joining protein LigD [Asticcacaulis solisilvae]MDR6800163.1 bifunctional non-homologous end joining protein LigD [Asticcacaulis sp. BE141]
MDDLTYRPRSAKPSPAKTAKANLQFRDLELATLADAVPEGPDWVHEVKFDGYRTLTVIDGGQVTMYSRSGLDWTSKYRDIARRLKAFKVDNAILDGEIVALNEHGASSFSRLKAELTAGRSDELQYYVFDLLVLNGEDVSRQTLLQRKAKLEALFSGVDFGNHVIYSEHFQENANFLPHLCSLDMEGIISKRVDSPYSGKRGKAWLKVKCHKRQEFVVVGFTESSHVGRGFRSLLLGYYDGPTLKFAGKVGTGFNDDTLREIRKKLDQIKVIPKPFSKLPPDVGKGTWIEPKLVCEVEFTEWTPEGRLRHPSFQGLREDKPAKAIARDTALPVATAVRAAAAEVTTEPAKPAKARHPAAPLKSSDRIDVSGIGISHPNRVVFPALGVTKLELARYYASVAERILPHVAHRPLSLVRVPENVDGQQFFQRHLPERGGLHNVKAVDVPVKDRTEEYMQIEDRLGLLSLVQWGGIEFHPWGSRADRPTLPDRMIFDLDPDPEAPWESVTDGAAEIRDRMTELGLESFLKTTGGKGLHVVVPIERKYGWPAIKAFTKAIAESMAQDSPMRFIANMSKAKRKGRIFVDYLRNDLTSTAASAFSVRARSGAGVSTPLFWKELSPKLRPSDYNIETIVKRLDKQKADPWADYFEVRQQIRPEILKALKIDPK